MQPYSDKDNNDHDEIEDEICFNIVLYVHIAWCMSTDAKSKGKWVDIILNKNIIFIMK